MVTQAVVFGLQNFFNPKLSSKFRLGQQFYRPHPKPVNQRKAWKSRRQHGTGKGV